MEGMRLDMKHEPLADCKIGHCKFCGELLPPRNPVVNSSGIGTMCGKCFDLIWQSAFEVVKSEK